MQGQVWGPAGATAVPSPGLHDERVRCSQSCGPTGGAVRGVAGVPGDGEQGHQHTVDRGLLEDSEDPPHTHPHPKLTHTAASCTQLPA